MPLLSLCVIALDQADLLAGALDSVAGVVDEAIVVDCGSSDATAEVARSRGARVIPFAWDDDYAAARNAAVEAATGDWVLMLDCDERLRPGFGEALRRALAAPEGADAFLVDLVQRDTGGGEVRNRYLRLGRRGGRRFVRRVHERVEPPFERVAHLPVEIEHVGYAESGGVEKMRRYARVLRRALDEEPGDLYLAIDLAHTLHNLREPGWRLMFDAASARLDVDAARPQNPEVQAWLEMALDLPEAELPRGIDSPLLDALAERWYPRALPLLAIRALRRLKAEDPQGSAELGERALALWASGGYDPGMPFDPASLRGGLHLHHGIALARLGRPDAARAQLRHAEAFPQTAALARENARRLGLSPG